MKGYCDTLSNFCAFSLCRYLPFLILLIFGAPTSSYAREYPNLGVGNTGGRYSYSLTTFDPTGKLQQVEHASRAASLLGTPVIAACLDSNRTIVFVSSQNLASPLINDDGTRRFCQVTKNIAIAHSGIGADGRKVVSEAQRLAVEHEFTFDQEIPINIFLEDMALLFQKYTMMPGVRPFGCSLIVAYVGDFERIYRINPSGAVEDMGKLAILGSNIDPDIFSNSDLRWETEDAITATNILINTLRKYMDKQAAKGLKVSIPKSKRFFLTASLSKRGFIANRVFL